MISQQPLYRTEKITLMLEERGKSFCGVFFMFIEFKMKRLKKVFVFPY